MRRAALSLLLLLASAPAFGQATRYVSPTGSATWAAAVNISTPASMSTANASAVAGQIVACLPGTYSTGISPVNDGTANSRITYMGAANDSASVIVPSISLTRDYVTVKWMRVTGNASINSSSGGAAPNSAAMALRDSIHNCAILGGLNLTGSEYATISNCRVGRQNGPTALFRAGSLGNWCIGASINDNAFFFVGASGSDAMTIDGCINSSWNRTRVSTHIPSTVSGNQNLFMLFRSQGNSFTDCSWDALNSTTTNDMYMWNMRDSSRFNVAVRCTMVTNPASVGTVEFAFSTSGCCGSVPGCCEKVNWNEFHYCVIYTTGLMRAQHAVSGLTLNHCQLTIGSNSTTGFIGGLNFTKPDSCTFTHNTIVLQQNSTGTNQFLWDNSTVDPFTGSTVFKNNIIVARRHTSTQPVLVLNPSISGGNTIDWNHNLYYSYSSPIDSTRIIDQGGGGVRGFPMASSSWCTTTGADCQARFGDPGFADINARNYAPSPTGNAVGAWWPDGYVGAISGNTGGITVTPTSGLVTNEQGTLHPTFSVVLTGAPAADVTISITSSNTAEGTVDKSSLTFTSVNWATPQVVTLTGVDDVLDDGDIPYTIVTGAATSTDAAYSGLNPSDVSATNLDDDVTCTPSILITRNGTTTTEGGGSATFTVALSCEPTTDVDLDVSSLNELEGVVNGSPTGGDLVFDAIDYADPRTFTIAGVDEFVQDGNVAYQVQVRLISLDTQYDGMKTLLNFTNTDNDVAGVTVFPSAGLVTTEAGGQASFLVRLTSQPTASVVIPLSSSNTAEGTVSPSSLTFTTANWSVYQAVTVTGVDDLVQDGSVAYSIVTGQCQSADAVYSAIDAANVSVTNIDDDDAFIVVSPTAGLVTTEAGGQASFTIVLTTEPTDDVTIDIASSDLTEGTVSPASVTFTSANWDTPQTVTVTGQDDGLTDGDIGYSIVTDPASSADGAYDTVDPDDVSVVNTDDEVAPPVATSFTYRLQSEGSRRPVNQRVAVVWDSRWAALFGTSASGSLNNMERSFGNLFEMLQLQGCQVDHYESNWFEKTDGNNGNQRNLAMWQTLGSNYGLAIMPYWSASGAASRKTYFSADSTTVPLLHIGGAGNSGATSWADSSYGLVDRAMAGIGGAAFFTNSRGSVRPYVAAASDTLWIAKGGIGTRCITLPPGVTSVVRLFEPQRLAGAGAVSFSEGPDSAFSTFPAAGDSVAKANEWMPLAWRAYWSSGRSVDYVKVAGNAFYSDGNVGHIAYALAARRLAINPIKFALEWDDMTDLNSTTGYRASNAAMDSLIVEFRDVWGIPTTVDVDPRNASAYIRGVTPDFEAAAPWSGPGWSWMRHRQATWIHHSHDSTSSHPSANLLGRFGGYGPGNSAIDSTGSFGSRFKYAHRYASRYDPTNANSSQRYGIVQRLAWSDSVRRAVCPECFIPPYMSFPNNEALPMGWRVRPLLANPSWKVYAGDGGSPIDSMMWALDTGLVVPQGTKLYLRAQFTTSPGSPVSVAWRPFGDRSVLNHHFSADHDSLPANSPFTFPDERWTARVAGRHIEAVNVAANSFDGVSYANYVGSSNSAVAIIFGMRNPVQTGGGTAYLWNESFSLDPSGIYSVNGAARNLGSRQRTRMTYYHPGSFLHAQGPLGSYATDVFRIGILRPIRGLESLAGKRLIQWVRPWEVYQP